MATPRPTINFSRVNVPTIRGSSGSGGPVTAVSGLNDLARTLRNIVGDLSDEKDEQIRENQAEAQVFVDAVMFADEEKSKEELHKKWADTHGGQDISVLDRRFGRRVDVKHGQRNAIDANISAEKGITDGSIRTPEDLDAHYQDLKDFHELTERSDAQIEATDAYVFESKVKEKLSNILFERVIQEKKAESVNATVDTMVLATEQFGADDDPAAFAFSIDEAMINAKITDNLNATEMGRVAVESFRLSMDYPEMWEAADDVFAIYEKYTTGPERVMLNEARLAAHRSIDNYADAPTPQQKREVTQLNAEFLVALAQDKGVDAFREKYLKVGNLYAVRKHNEVQKAFNDMDGGGGPTDAQVADGYAAVEIFNRNGNAEGLAEYMTNEWIISNTVTEDGRRLVTAAGNTLKSLISEKQIGLSVMRAEINDEVTRLLDTGALEDDPDVPIAPQMRKDFAEWIEDNPTSKPSEQRKKINELLTQAIKDGETRKAANLAAKTPARSVNEGIAKLQLAAEDSGGIIKKDDLADADVAFFHKLSDKWLRENAIGEPDDEGALHFPGHDPHAEDLGTAREEAIKTETTLQTALKVERAAERRLKALKEELEYRRSLGKDVNEDTILIGETFTGDAESTNIIDKIRDPNS